MIMGTDVVEMCSFKKSARLLACVIAVLTMLLFASCTVKTEVSQDQDIQIIEAPAKYEFESISVDSITAVVGSKSYLGESKINDGSAYTVEYKYYGISSNDLSAYGEYLLQNGFEEIQTNVYSTSTSDGITLKITLEENLVTLNGTKS